MLTGKLLLGFSETQFITNIRAAGRDYPQLSRPNNNFARRFKSLCLTTTALVGYLALAPVPTQAFTIQGGTTETVIGTGGGTQVSPWAPGQLALGQVGNGTLNITATGVVNSLDIILGNGTGTTGTLSLNGASSLNSSSFISVAEAGNSIGVLQILGGSTFTQTGGLNSTASIGTGFGSQGTVTVSGTGSTWTIPPELLVGNSGSGTLNVTSGGLVSVGDFLTLGRQATGVGLINVSGSNSRLTIGAGTFVGNSGEGTLNVSSGGFASSVGDINLGRFVGSKGTINVDGANSQFTSSRLFAGNFGEAVVTVTNGGVLTTNSFSTIGFANTSEGTVTVGGMNSQWNIGNGLRLAESGKGTLNIQSGGLVSVGGDLEVGRQPTGVGAINISGTGSALGFTTVFRIGKSGQGTVTISSGATATGTLATVHVGNLNNSQGQLTVDGAGSAFTSRQLYIGDNGVGRVDIINGGKVTTTFLANVGLAASGTGTVTVSGANSLWDAQSTMNIGQFGNGSLNISQAGRVNVANGLDVGDLNGGTGTVTIADAGSVLAVTGLLRVGNAGEGSLTLSDMGQVSVNAGTGSLTIASNNTGVGTVNIGAAAGDTARGAGTINAALVIFGAGTGKLVFNHTDTNYIFAPQVTGTGTIDHLAGSTSLTGDFSLFTGTINVNGGTLSVNTNLSTAGAVNVNGGILGGSGTLSSINVMNGGTLAPGNSIGTLNIVGNASLASGSTYAVEINNAGASDLLNVGGTLTIGATASVLFSPENGTDTGVTYTDGQVYTIATAATGVTGTFGSVTDTFAFLSGALSYDANNVFLTITRDADFITVARTLNQKAAARGAQATGPGNAVFDALVALNATTARNAFDLLSGEIHASAKSTFVEGSRNIREASLARLMRKTDPKKQLWGKLYGSFTSLRGNGNAATTDSGSGGLIAGYDAKIDNWRFGSAVQIGRTNLSSSSRESSGNSTDYGASLYGSVALGNTSLALGGAYLRHAIDTSRMVAFGTLSEQLTAGYNASTTQIFGEISHEFGFGNTKLTPFAKASYIMQQTDGFAESGGAAALSVAGDRFNTTFTTLGLNAEHKFIMGSGMKATLSGTLGWRHAFNTDPQTVNRFAGGNGFTISGSPISSDTLVIAAGIDMALSAKVDLGVNYSGQVGIGGNQSHSLRAILSARF